MLKITIKYGIRWHNDDVTHTFRTKSVCVLVCVLV